ncbi:MAG: hypothetical protein JWR69_3124 [Pedosphaera sp.]|nr:hypothetical protein [Pedosphaera sp.]
MKNLGLLLFVFLASLVGASAQVTVEVITEQDQFLPNESLSVAVRVVNRSGQTLQLGKDEDWLTFSIEARDGFIVFKSGEVPVVQEFDLDSSKMATKHVDLAPYFNITKPGRYTVTAAVKIKNWNAQVTSEAKAFDIVRGVKLWEQEFGVPPTSIANQGQPEVRKYTLQKAVYKTTTKLYLRLTDGPESQVFGVFPIGPMVSFSRLEPQLDKLSNLHLAYQTGSHTFLYSVINPQGTVIQRQTFEYTTTRPRLKMDDSGKISIVGGVRHFADNDIPASGELLSSDVVKSPKP